MKPRHAAALALVGGICLFDLNFSQLAEDFDVLEKGRAAVAEPISR